MIVVVLAMAVVGWLSAGRYNERWVIIALGALFIILAIARGYYWHGFDRGAGLGWFTHNRVSAIGVFVITAISVSRARLRLLP